jgi:hypothetical protein
MTQGRNINYQTVDKTANFTFVRNLDTGFYTRKFLAIGRSLTVAGHSGTLTAITPADTVPKQ